MTAALADLAARYRFNERLLHVETEGFSAADWDRPAGERGGNSARWILGHVAVHRRLLRRKAGEDLPVEPWEAGYAGRGTAPVPAAPEPSPAALASDVLRSGERITALLPGMSTVESERAWGGNFPDGGSTLEAGARFLYFHETYHLGQIGLLRRICGHPGFV